MVKLALLVVALVTAFGRPSVAAPDACGIEVAPAKFPNQNGVFIAIDAVHDALLFRLPRNHMSLDLDGNEHTYGIRDQGIDGICNGLSALNPPACAGVTPRGACFAACQQAIRAWD